MPLKVEEHIGIDYETTRYKPMSQAPEDYILKIIKGT
jgi:hypothetical protein